MKLGIDASNIRAGGGITNLVELLCAFKPEEESFENIIIWGGKWTLSHLENRIWLQKAYEPMLDRALPYRFLWQRFVLDRLVRREGCDILFVPGGSFTGRFRPFVSISRNMLPFEWREARRFGISWLTFKFILLRRLQLSTIKKADGYIFLTNYAYMTIGRLLKQANRKVMIIPHGVSNRFRQEPREQKSIAFYSYDNPFRLLYVSPIAPYKHQDRVIEAVAKLRYEGLPLTLKLVGASSNRMSAFCKRIYKVDPMHEWIRYEGQIAFSNMHSIYQQAELFVFASSCENMPNILLESMAAGLPIACSNRGPMPEVLKDAGVYFDPEKPAEIAKAIQDLLENPDLRARKAWAAYEYAMSYSWESFTRKLFNFFGSFKNESIT